MAVHFKTIKPTKMKEELFRREARNALKRVGRRLKADYEATTQTWERRPEFKVITRVRQTEDFVAVSVTTDSQVYAWVDKGTQPHLIFAGYYTGKSDKKVLAFGAAFEPKTTPGIIGSTEGLVGGPTLFRAYVQHPGTEARRFTEVIEEITRERFYDEIHEALRRAARGCGHYVGR
jgi:hypothetical protein